MTCMFLLNILMLFEVLFQVNIIVDILLYTYIIEKNIVQ